MIEHIFFIFSWHYIDRISKLKQREQNGLETLMHVKKYLTKYENAH